MNKNFQEGKGEDSLSSKPFLEEFGGVRNFIKEQVQEQIEVRKKCREKLQKTYQTMLNDIDQLDWIEPNDLQSFSFEGLCNNPEASIDGFRDGRKASLICLRPPFADLESREEHLCYWKKNDELYFYSEGQSETKKLGDIMSQRYIFEQSPDMLPENQIAQEREGEQPRRTTNREDSSEEDSSESRRRCKGQKEKKVKKEKGGKNQYDKNIFANITAVVLKKMVSREARQEVEYYCQYKQVDFESFHSHFASLERVKKRLGTTQIANFYSSQQFSDEFKAVFSMFFVRFLRNEYLRYVLREGKMQEKEKYLRCATKMMYITVLSRGEQNTISYPLRRV